MTTGVMAVPLALLLLVSNLSARPHDGRDFDAVVRDLAQSHSTARTVDKRLRVLTDAVGRRGAPLPVERAGELAQIRELVGEGRFTPAAKALDGLLAELTSEPRPRHEASVPEGLRGEVPTLLSKPAHPVSAAPLPGDAPPSGAVFARPFSPQPEKDSRPAWELWAAVAAGVALMGLSTLGPWSSSAPKNGEPPATAHPAVGKPVPKLEPPTPMPAPAPPPPPAPAAASGLAALSQKYEVGKTIASGGMGEIYEGRDLKLGRKVAIKRMLPDVKLDSELRALFLKEARTVAKLNHPFIVQIHDTIESGEELYLVFEFVEGETLSQRLTREARLPLKECRRIFGYVCEAIDHAHKSHVLHRDIKPANIMIDRSGIARVMDFGIALESTRTLSTVSAQELDVAGTPRYMAPEQHFGRSVRSSDIYAMGVCLYEMATGHTPFSASNVDDLIQQKRSRKFPQATTLAPGLGKEFDVLIAAALAPDPASRISNALEFLEALDSVVAAQRAG